MLAMVEGGVTVAMCLNRKSPEGSHYTSGGNRCDVGEEGLPVDLEHVPEGQLERSLEYRR